MTPRLDEATLAVQCVCSRRLQAACFLGGLSLTSVPNGAIHYHHQATSPSLAGWGCRRGRGPACCGVSFRACFACSDKLWEGIFLPSCCIQLTANATTSQAKNDIAYPCGVLHRAMPRHGAGGA